MEDVSDRPRILLTHTPEMRRNYYGERALAGLAALGEVVLHEGASPLDTPALIAAAKGCQVIVVDRATPCGAGLFGALPDLVSVSRVAVDIRNIEVEAASTQGVLVTQASRSWVAAVSELAIGLMIDAARGISRANIAYKTGRAPDVGMGRQLAGATAGIIGYGPLGMRVTELLPRCASIADKFSLLRSVAHTGGGHPAGSLQVLSGDPDAQDKLEPLLPDFMPVAHYLRYDPGRRIALRGRDREGVRIDIDAVVLPAPDTTGRATELRWSIRITLPLKYVLFESMARPQVERAALLDIEALRVRLESPEKG